MCRLLTLSRVSLRLHPAAPRSDRVALEDDVIPFGSPVTTANGEVIMSLPIKAGQVGSILILAAKFLTS